MSQKTEIKVPDLGSDSDVPVIDILVSVGDFVQVEQLLVTVELDKATVDIPSPATGIVESLQVKIGDKVSPGKVLLVLQQVNGAIFEKNNDGSNTSIVPKKELPLVASSSNKKSCLMTMSLPDVGIDGLLPVVEIFATVGTKINIDDPIISLESDKATIDIPSLYAGTVHEIMVTVGDRIAKGTSIALIKTDERELDDLKETASINKTALSCKADNIIVSENVMGDSTRRAYASPSIRKLARELDINIDLLHGSGRYGRILREDLYSYQKSLVLCEDNDCLNDVKISSESDFPKILPWPNVNFQKFGPCRLEPLPRLRKISGENLHRNWIRIPHVTAHDDVDITELEAFRLRENKRCLISGANIKLTILAFVMKAVVSALKRFPILNSSLVGQELVLKEYFNIGFAADTEHGLVVPVVKNVDTKNVLPIAQEIAHLAERARNNQLKTEDMQGGCFSISSLGGIGGRYFTPIINAPEVAILGIGRGADRAIYVDGELKKRFMLPLSLSYDHRVIDGATAARFNSYFSELLSDFRMCLL